MSIRIHEFLLLDLMVALCNPAATSAGCPKELYYLAEDDDKSRECECHIFVAG